MCSGLFSWENRGAFPLPPHTGTSINVCPVRMFFFSGRGLSKYEYQIMTVKMKAHLEIAIDALGLPVFIASWGCFFSTSMGHFSAILYKQAVKCPLVLMRRIFVGHIDHFFGNGIQRCWDPALYRPGRIDCSSDCAAHCTELNPQPFGSFSS